jgi:gas vesicle protein
MTSRTAAYLMLLTGLAAGTVIGLLLAPEKGKDTRDMLLRKGRDLYDRVRHHAQEEDTPHRATTSSKRRNEGTASSAA